MSASHAEVLRDGKIKSILAADIVPGDVIIVICIEIKNNILD